MLSFLDNVFGVIDKDVEKLLRRIFFWFLLLTFITTAACAFCGYLAGCGWRIGDWLINYQGGMVRRGLLGEFFYHSSRFAHVDPGLSVFLFQTLCYAVFFVLAYLLLKKQHSLIPYIFLIFSPFIFTFQIYDPQGGCRKEIIYFAFLAFTIYSASTYDIKKFKNIFYLILLFYPVLILSHEMFMVFLPYLFCAFIAVGKASKKDIFFVSFLLVLSLASFLTATYYSGTTLQAAAISESIAKEGYVLSFGAIQWLDKTASYGMERVIYLIHNKRYIYYFLQVLMLSSLAFIPLRKKLGFILRDKLSKGLIALILLGSLPLFVVTLDWGRLIYIHLVSLFLLSLLPVNSQLGNERYILRKRPDTGKNHKNKTKLFTLFALVILYSQFWFVPHFGNPNPYPKKILRINVLKYRWPFATIKDRYF